MLADLPAEAEGKLDLVLMAPPYMPQGLGPWGAVYTEGWDRRVKSQGKEAKATKETINCQRIYPPRGGGRDALFEAAEAAVQAPPPLPNA